MQRTIYRNRPSQQQQFQRRTWVHPQAAKVDDDEDKCIIEFSSDEEDGIPPVKPAVPNGAQGQQRVAPHAHLRQPGAAAAAAAARAAHRPSRQKPPALNTTAVAGAGPAAVAAVAAGAGAAAVPPSNDVSEHQRKIQQLMKAIEAKAKPARVQRLPQANTATAAAGADNGAAAAAANGDPVDDAAANPAADEEEAQLRRELAALVQDDQDADVAAPQAAAAAMPPAPHGNKPAQAARAGGSRAAAPAAARGGSASPAAKRGAVNAAGASGAAAAVKVKPVAKRKQSTRSATPDPAGTTPLSSIPGSPAGPGPAVGGSPAKSTPTKGLKPAAGVPAAAAAAAMGSPGSNRSPSRLQAGRPVKAKPKAVPNQQQQQKKLQETQTPSKRPRRDVGATASAPSVAEQEQQPQHLDGVQEGALVPIPAQQHHQQQAAEPSITLPQQHTVTGKVMFSFLRGSLMGNAAVAAELPPPARDLLAARDATVLLGRRLQDQLRQLQQRWQVLNQRLQQAPAALAPPVVAAFEAGLADASSALEAAIQPPQQPTAAAAAGNGARPAHAGALASEGPNWAVLHEQLQAQRAANLAALQEVIQRRVRPTQARQDQGDTAAAQAIAKHPALQPPQPDADGDGQRPDPRTAAAAGAGRASADNSPAGACGPVSPVAKAAASGKRLRASQTAAQPSDAQKDSTDGAPARKRQCTVTAQAGAAAAAASLSKAKPAVEASVQQDKASGRTSADEHLKLRSTSTEQDRRRSPERRRRGRSRSSGRDKSRSRSRERARSKHDERDRSHDRAYRSRADDRTQGRGRHRSRSRSRSNSRDRGRHRSRSRRRADAKGNSHRRSSPIGRWRSCSRERWGVRSGTLKEDGSRAQTSDRASHSKSPGRGRSAPLEQGGSHSKGNSPSSSSAQPPEAAAATAAPSNQTKQRPSAAGKAQSKQPTQPESVAVNKSDEGRKTTADPHTISPVRKSAKEADMPQQDKQQDKQPSAARQPTGARAASVPAAAAAAGITVAAAVQPGPAKPSPPLPPATQGQPGVTTAAATAGASATPGTGASQGQQTQVAAARQAPSQQQAAKVTKQGPKAAKKQQVAAGQAAAAAPDKPQGPAELPPAATTAAPSPSATAAPHTAVQATSYKHAAAKQAFSPLQKHMPELSAPPAASVTGQTAAQQPAARNAAGAVTNAALPSSPAAAAGRTASKAAAVEQQAGLDSKQQPAATNSTVVAAVQPSAQQPQPAGAAHEPAKQAAAGAGSQQPAAQQPAAAGRTAAAPTPPARPSVAAAATQQVAGAAPSRVASANSTGGKAVAAVAAAAEAGPAPPVPHSSRAEAPSTRQGPQPPPPQPTEHQEKAAAAGTAHTVAAEPKLVQQTRAQKAPEAANPPPAAAAAAAAGVKAPPPPHSQAGKVGQATAVGQAAQATAEVPAGAVVDANGNRQPAAAHPVAPQLRVSRARSNPLPSAAAAAAAFMSMLSQQRASPLQPSGASSSGWQFAPQLEGMLTSFMAAAACGLQHASTLPWSAGSSSTAGQAASTAAHPAAAPPASGTRHMPKGKYSSSLAAFGAYRMAPQYAAIHGVDPASSTFCHCIDPDWPLCQYDWRGRHVDATCTHQHQNDATPQLMEVAGHLERLLSSAGVPKPAAVVQKWKAAMQRQQTRKQASKLLLNAATAAHADWVSLLLSQRETAAGSADQQRPKRVDAAARSKAGDALVPNSVVAGTALACAAGSAAAGRVHAAGQPGANRRMHTQQPALLATAGVVGSSMSRLRQLTFQQVALQGGGAPAQGVRHWLPGVQLPLPWEEGHIADYGQPPSGIDLYNMPDIEQRREWLLEVQRQRASTIGVAADDAGQRQQRGEGTDWRYFSAGNVPEQQGSQLAGGDVSVPATVALGPVEATAAALAQVDVMYGAMQVQHQHDPDWWLSWALTLLGVLPGPVRQLLYPTPGAPQQQQQQQQAVAPVQPVLSDLLSSATERLGDALSKHKRSMKLWLLQLHLLQLRSGFDLSQAAIIGRAEGWGRRCYQFWLVAGLSQGLWQLQAVSWVKALAGLALAAPPARAAARASDASDPMTADNGCAGTAAAAAAGAMPAGTVPDQAADATLASCVLDIALRLINVLCEAGSGVVLEQLLSAILAACAEATAGRAPVRPDLAQLKAATTAFKPHLDDAAAAAAQGAAAAVWDAALSRLIAAEPLGGLAMQGLVAVLVQHPLELTVLLVCAAHAAACGQLPRSVLSRLHYRQGPLLLDAAEFAELSGAASGATNAKLQLAGRVLAAAVAALLDGSIAQGHHHEQQQQRIPSLALTLARDSLCCTWMALQPYWQLLGLCTAEDAAKTMLQGVRLLQPSQKHLARAVNSLYEAARLGNISACARGAEITIMLILDQHDHAEPPSAADEQTQRTSAADQAILRVQAVMQAIQSLVRVVFPAGDAAGAFCGLWLLLEQQGQRPGVLRHPEVFAALAGMACGIDCCSLAQQLSQDGLSALQLQQRLLQHVLAAGASGLLYSRAQKASNQQAGPAGAATAAVPGAGSSLMQRLLASNASALEAVRHVLQQQPARAADEVRQSFSVLLTNLQKPPPGQQLGGARTAAAVSLQCCLTRLNWAGYEASIGAWGQACCIILDGAAEAQQQHAVSAHVVALLQGSFMGVLAASSAAPAAQQGEQVKALLDSMVAVFGAQAAPSTAASLPALQYPAVVYGDPQLQQRLDTPSLQLPHALLSHAFARLLQPLPLQEVVKAVEVLVATVPATPGMVQLLLQLVQRFPMERALFWLLPLLTSCLYSAKPAAAAADWAKVVQLTQQISASAAEAVARRGVELHPWSQQLWQLHVETTGEPHGDA